MTDSSRRFVVVGVDGSNGSAVALRWALDHADHLGDIEPVTTFVTGPMVREVGPADAGDEPYRSEATRQLRVFLESHAPWLVDSGVVLESRAGPGLVKAAAAAELLVVGTRGWGDRADLSVGSVGSYCARHSTVPVALIPAEVPSLHDHLDVVVGFDGSRHSRDALRWTLRHVRRSARVTVVRAFTDERVAGEVLRPAEGRAEDTARSELEHGVAVVLEHLPGHPPVEMAVLPGDPRAVLRSASVGADLLVVGARGHGVLEHLLLGSVASALAHHPAVPTIVVPGAAGGSVGRSR
ncbi:MAG: universal stress protein [Acidobacteriota bacterium]